MAKTDKQRNSRRTRAPFQIFLSHATADKFIAVAMCRLLDETGATTFRDDRDIDGGDDIPDSIRSAIEHANEFVVLLTPNSVTRPWVNLEIGAAWGWARLRIVLVYYNMGVDSLPVMLKSKKAVALNDFKMYVDEVAKRMKP